MKLHKIVFMAACILVASNYAFAQHEANDSGVQKAGMKFVVDDASGNNSVTFKSTAPLEDIVGTSSQITGYVIFDPKNPMKGGHGEFKVPVASLNTGIPLRDEHVRSEAWLNASEYPHFTFVIHEAKDIKEVKSSPEASTYDAILVGEFSFHGVTQKVEFPGRFTYLRESEKTKQHLPGDLLAGRASFKIALKDFGVTGPPGMGLIGSKVGEIISVDVSFMGSAEPMIAENTPNP